MKVPIEWLKDFVEIKTSPEKLGEKLTLAGLGVESVNNGILDLEITPNRSDCLSILGVAREVAAIENLKLKNKKLSFPQGKCCEGRIPFQVQFSEPKICLRYSYQIIDGIKIAPSPQWLQKRLIAYGFRPINNIVDITNYVMIAFGQPLHAFDEQTVSGRRLIVRQTVQGENLTTLDGINRELDNGMLVIQDNGKIIDLAGIMGGQNSEVSSNTKTIILQAAIFDPILIRRTSKKLGLITEASYRYERGIDPQGTISALKYASSLILETAGGRAGEIIDIQNRKYSPVKIKWEPENTLARVLGIKIKQEKIQEYLKRLDIKCEQNGQICQIPSYRLDLKSSEDLVEEVARLYGYSNLPKTRLSVKKPAGENKNWSDKQKIKDYLVHRGFTEIKSYPYLSISDLEKAGFQTNNCWEIANPLSPDTQFLRPSLLPPILKQIAKNPWSPELKLFEFGRIFSGKNEKEEIILASTVPKIEDLELKEIKPKILDKFKIRRKIYFAVFAPEEFLRKIKLPAGFQTNFPKIVYQPVSPFPPVVFDLAIIVDKKTLEEKVEKIIRQTSPMIFQLELFDLYTGRQLGQGKKSLAYHLTISSPDHTLRDEEVKNIRQKIITGLKIKLKAEIRGEKK